jgi:AcrR family transcriptional regulator
VAVETPKRKGDRTRAAILKAARETFHEAGFNASSVRTIARRANIDPSMIIRYFGSKQELFVAAVSVKLDVPNLSEVPAARRGEVLVAHFVSRWEGERSDDILIMLLRSAMTNEDAAKRLREVFDRQVVEALKPVTEKSELKRRAALVASQMLGLALTRYILRLPGAIEMSPDEIVRALSPTVGRYLRGALPD